MRRVWKYALAAVALAMAPLAVAGDSGRQGEVADPDIVAIRALYHAWNEAVEGSDIAGYLAALDTDVELLPADAPPVRGRDSYGVFLQPVFASDAFEIEVVVAPSVQVDGDLAYARYDYIIHRMPVGGEARISSYRKFLDVLRRQPDGSWRVFKHTWNYNEPGVMP